MGSDHGTDFERSTSGFFLNPGFTRLSSFNIVFTSTVKVRMYWVFFSRRENTIDQQPTRVFGSRGGDQALLANSLPFILYFRIGFG